MFSEGISTFAFFGVQVNSTSFRHTFQSLRKNIIHVLIMIYFTNQQEIMHKVQSPNNYGLDPILRARSGEEPIRCEGSIGVASRYNYITNSSSKNILNIKSDSSLESIGVFEGFHNESSNINNMTIDDNMIRMSTILGDTTCDDNATTTSETRKVRWGPSTKAPQQGCGINSSGSMQLADLYQGIVNISSTLGKSAYQLGERIEVLGMTCSAESHVLRGECTNAFDAACGDHFNGSRAGGRQFYREEDNSIIYTSDNFVKEEPFKRENTPEKRDAIKESRDALDSYDKMRESREGLEESRYKLNDDKSKHFTFNEFYGERTDKNEHVAGSSREHVAGSSRAVGQKQRPYFYSPTSNRESMNNIETGMGTTVNMMSPTYHRSPRMFGIDSSCNNATRSPVSILKKNQSRYAYSGTNTFPSTTSDERVKLRKSPRTSDFSGKPPTPTFSTTTSSPIRGKVKKKNSSRRVLGGLVKKSLKFMSHRTKSQAYPKSTLVIASSTSPRSCRY